MLWAAHVALGLSLDDRSVEQGRVLFFAGENPDDVRMRWIKLCENLKQDPDMMDVVFMPGARNITTDAEIIKRIAAEARERGPFSLLIIDTAAAYFQGDDENSNAQMASPGDRHYFARDPLRLVGSKAAGGGDNPMKTDPDHSNSVVVCAGGAMPTDAHLLSIVHCEDDEIIEWLEWRERRLQRRRERRDKSHAPKETHNPPTGSAKSIT